MAIDIILPKDDTHPDREWRLVNDDEVDLERLVAPGRRRKWHVSAKKGVAGGTVEYTSIISKPPGPTRIRRKTHVFTNESKPKRIGGARVKTVKFFV